MPQPTLCSAELVERINVSDTLAVLKFLSSEQLSFKAGQYATLGPEADGNLLERPYSIVSSPYERSLEFYVELVPDGLLTPRLWDLKLGSRILIRQRVDGNFTLDRSVNRLLMLATVTGIAPFVSTVRTQRIDRERGTVFKDQLLVLHGASRAADFGPYLDELEELSHAGWLTYIPTVSRPWEEPNWHGEIGRVEDVVRKHGDRLGFDHNNAVAYACGHPQMVENVKGILSRARFPAGRIKEEEYFAIHQIPP